MNPIPLIPAPDPLQVHFGWFAVLSFATLVLHLLLMNAMLGLTMLAFWRELKSGDAPDVAARLAGGKIPTLTALTVNMAVPPLLFLQVVFGNFHYPSAIMMAPYWLGLFVIVILAYYAAYIYYLRHDRLARGCRLRVIGAATLFYLAAGFILVNKMTLMLRPEAWAEFVAKGGGVILNLTDPALIPRYLHFVVSAAAIGGLALAILAHLGRDKNPAEAARLRKMGLSWFTLATMSQLVIGGVFLAALPRPVMAHFAGGKPLHTLVFAASLLMTFVCLIAAMRGKLGQTVVAVAVTVTLMTLMRDLVRLAYLEPYFHPADLPLKIQYSPFAVFLVSFVLAGAVIAYMVKLMLRSARRED